MLTLLIALLVQSAPERTATIRLQQAIVSTAEGKKAAARLDAEWRPRLTSLDKREADLKSEREKLDAESRVRHGIWPFRHAMTAKRKRQLEAALDKKATSLRRERDDDRANFQQEQIQSYNNLQAKMQIVLNRYTKENGYSVDVKAPGTISPPKSSSCTTRLIKLCHEGRK